MTVNDLILALAKLPPDGLIAVSEERSIVVFTSEQQIDVTMAIIRHKKHFTPEDLAWLSGMKISVVPKRAG